MNSQSPMKVIFLLTIFMYFNNLYAQTIPCTDIPAVMDRINNPDVCSTLLEELGSTLGFGYNVLTNVDPACPVGIPADITCIAEFVCDPAFNAPPVMPVCAFGITLSDFDAGCIGITDYSEGACEASCSITEQQWYEDLLNSGLCDDSNNTHFII